MKKLMMSLVVLGLMVMLSGCARVSLKPESFGEIESKKADYAYVYGTYFYKERPFGVRLFRLSIDSVSHYNDENLLINFEITDIKKYFLFNVKAGSYKIKTIRYTSGDNSITYSYKNIDKEVNFEAGKIYYMGNFEVLLNDPTTMRIDTFVPLLELATCNKGRFDYRVTNLIDEDKTILENTFPSLKGFPIVESIAVKEVTK